MTGERGHIVKQSILSVKPTPALSFHKKNCLIKILLSSWGDFDLSAATAALPALWDTIQACVAQVAGRLLV